VLCAFLQLVAAEAALFAGDTLIASRRTTPDPDRESPGHRNEPVQLVLEAVPRIGFRPLQVSLTGTLRGVAGNDENFCHVDQLWFTRRGADTGVRERTSARRPRCQHPPEQTRVERRFYRDLRLNSAGVYVYRLELEPKDGSKLISNPVTIQVLAKP